MICLVIFYAFQKLNCIVRKLFPVTTTPQHLQGFNLSIFGGTIICLFLLQVINNIQNVGQWYQQEVPIMLHLKITQQVQSDPLIILINKIITNSKDVQKYA